jgi:hypothetical protein
MILGREDVAARPAHLSAEVDQRLDQHRRLDGHVQRAGDPRPAQRLCLRELRPHGHQARHLMLGELDLFPPIGGERKISDLVPNGFHRHFSPKHHDWW